MRIWNFPLRMKSGLRSWRIPADAPPKLEPRLLAGVLEGIGRGSDDNLLVGAETSDDGAIYRINDQVAMIQTLDFFPPMVDDPWDFGQVAAANALSDIYAMGGEPKVALNIAAFPSGLDTGILKKILEGGASKILEAGAVMAGGPYDPG